MKFMIGSGLCLALAFVSAGAFAEEIQWRSATAKPVTSAPALTPVSYSVPAATQSAATGLDLGRPIASAGPMQTTSSNSADSQTSGPDLGQPLPLIRGQAADAPAQPLPVGFPARLENGTQGVKGASSAQGVKPIPMPLESDFVSPMPKVVPGTSMAPPVAMSDAGGFAGSSPGMLSGAGIVSLGDCGCGCFNDCCDSCGCGDCCPYRGNRVYASASYLGWWFQRKNVPPLVTVSPAGTPAGTTGVLGQPTTTVVFGQDNQENTYHSGGRLNLGLWMPGGNWALEVDYFYLGQQSTNAAFGSNGDPQITRPVVIGGRETVQFVALPGVVTGSVGVNMFSQLWDIEMNARQKLFCGPRYWIDMLYGYRHLDLYEGISVGENLVQLNPAGNLGINILDQFRTRNVFNGGQIGIQAEGHFLNRWFLNGTFKLAMGDMREQVNINGLIAYTPLPGGQTAAFNTGILANGTNVGNHQSDRFAVIPEMNFKLGFELNEHWRVWAGYDFLFASSVVRPGDQIDRRVNPSQIPLPPPAGAQPLVGAAQPAVLFRTTSFVAQGVSFGLQYRW